VIVNGYRDGTTATTFTTEHPVNGVSDGSVGLGSEAGYFLSNGTLFSFTNSQEATDPPPPSTASAVIPNNFDGNGTSDLLWQNDAGSVAVWRVDGTQAVGSFGLTNPGPSWHIAGSGDFYHNGHSAILWQNDSGEAYIWKMNGTSVVGGGSLGNPGAS